ncbi:hypothetical protein [Leptolyngbya sp. FACHB-541]|uniref:hypothetical protein n=1 Tax=Leptolyngbya sp. FACHB-541 TaxID=2692810 RepID=UPI001687605F|nr:hypothetical protein [Leptolyngbya sp. FACHB-541]
MDFPKRDKELPLFTPVLRLRFQRKTHNGPTRTSILAFLAHKDFPSLDNARSPIF